MQAAPIALTELQGSKANEEEATCVCHPLEAALQCTFLVPYHRQESHEENVQGCQESNVEGDHVLPHRVLRGGSGGRERSTT